MTQCRLCSCIENIDNEPGERLFATDEKSLQRSTLIVSGILRKCLTRANQLNRYFLQTKNRYRVAASFLKRVLIRCLAMVVLTASCKSLLMPSSDRFLSSAFPADEKTLLQRSRAFLIRCLAMTYSHMGSPTLPSALRRFTSEFGKGSGGSISLWSPSKKGNNLNPVSHLFSAEF